MAPPALHGFKAQLLVLAGLLLTAAMAQPAATLDLSFGGDVYLSHVSAGLDGLSDYRQHYRQLSSDPATADGEPQLVSEWLNELLSSGDRHMAEASGGQMAIRRDSYLIAGQSYLYGRFPGDAICEALPIFVEIPPSSIGVANATGFKSATLASENELVNGWETARYRLDPPSYIPHFDEGGLSGDLWLALEGGHIVKYRIEGREGEKRTVWEYDLTRAEAIEGPPCAPEE